MIDGLLPVPFVELADELFVVLEYLDALPGGILERVVSPLDLVEDLAAEDLATDDGLDPEAVHVYNISSPAK